MGLGFILCLIAFFSFIPYTIVFILRFVLWKFSFTARVYGFFSFKEIMIRIPLHLNFAIILKIERLSFKFTLSSKMLKVSTYGLQVNILVRNDFNLWTTKKIEILQMLEDIRTSMKKHGLLSNEQVRNIASTLPSEHFGAILLKPEEKKNNSRVINNAQKTFIERTLEKLLGSVEVDLKDTFINFFAYKDEEKKIEETNVKKFNQNYLLDPEFRDQCLCFRVYIPKVELNVKSMNDEELDLFISADQLLLQHPTILHKQGILKGVTVLLKIPLDAKLAQDFCNFDLRINILRGNLSLNKKFIRDLTKFIVYIDTLKVIIKRIKTLITKLHYQDELFHHIQNGENIMDINAHTFENVMDIDIPKRLKVVIEEGLTVMLCQHSKKLKPFLTGGKDENNLSELVILNTHQITFELLRTLKNSYYLTVQSDKISVDCNLRRSIVIEKYNQEMDFCYKKSTTDLPIKISKMEIGNSIRCDKIIFDLTMSELKLILDIVDINEEMVCVANVKNKIMNILLDKEFLKNNLLHLGSSYEDKIKEDKILLLFQEMKDKDSLTNDFDILKIYGKFSTYDINNVISVDATCFKNKLKIDQGVQEVITKLDFINIQPLRENAISLLKIQNFENQLVAKKEKDNNLFDVIINFDKCHVNFNLDVILSMTQEIMDFTFIVKTYVRKWNAKYRIKEYIRKTIIQRLVITFEEAQFIWNMSRSRFLAFRIVEFMTKPMKCPFKSEDKIGMCFFVKEFYAYHQKSRIEEVIPGEFYCLKQEDKKLQTIIEVKDLEYKMIISAVELKIKFNMTKFQSNLPEDVHLGALIFEILKQYIFTRKWFIQEYIKTKRKNNVVFMKETPLRVENQKPLFNVPSNKFRRETLLVQMDVKEIIFQIDDTAFKQLFVNKNEIVDTLQERDIFKCKQPCIFKLLKKLKQTKLNEKVLIVQAKNFKMSFDCPQQFLDFNHVYLVISRLDEAKDCMSPNLFNSFDGGFHNYKADYVSIHSRNLLKPVVEIWDVDMKFLLIDAVLNADLNPALFKTKISVKIFNKFEVLYMYNKLEAKQYYDAEFKVEKIRVNLQGQQTVLFFEDLATVFDKFAYVDMTSYRDVRAQKLNYYSGIDQLRHKMHGKLKIMVGQIEGIVYPRRKFNKFDSYMMVSFQDLYFYELHTYQELVFKNLLVTKQPQRFFESAIVRIPLIELQVNTIYNQGKTLNHFTHNGVQNIGQLLDTLKAYSTQEMEIEVKLNIPSLGQRNETEQDQTQLASLMARHIEKSPIPIAHYQRCHMRFFDQILREYAKKADFSKPVQLKKNRDQGKMLKNKRSQLFQVKIKSFINDMMVLFTDFKEKLAEGFDFSLATCPDARSVKIQKDKYFAMFQGVMFSIENLCFKSLISANSQKDGVHIELKGSAIQSNFLKMAYINTNNLYQIRHQCFKQLRDKQFECSLDNYRHFCTFFELNPNQQQSMLGDLQSTSILTNFKTIYPLYILKNPALQQEIFIATTNLNQDSPFSSDDMIHTILDDFVFSNSDTIGTIIQISYCQDKEISFYHNSSQKMEEKKQQQRAKNPLILDIPSNKLDEERFTVKHMVDIKGIRFLYTKYTIELIIHHLIKGFNYKKFRKTDFIDVEKEKEAKEFKINGENSESNSKSESYGQSINLKALKKVALIGLRLEDPQINFQNEITKSQMLLSTARPTTAIIFGYHKSLMGPECACQNIMIPPPNEVQYDDLLRTKSGYQIKFHEELVKFDLQIQVVEMDIYVAPTVINLENPTFWISNLGQCNVMLMEASGVDQQQNISQKIDNKDIKGIPLSDKEHFRNCENLLRKIFSVSNISFTFDFLKPDFVDSFNPNMAIDILVEKLESEMNGPNMWHFIYVLKSILFARGEKPEELIQIEKKRIEEMQTIKLDMIKSIIDYKLKREVEPNTTSPISKKIQYTILNGEIKLQNFDQMFAQVVLSKLSGTNFIYQNRNSKQDIDIDRILIENYADTEQYRMVMFPGITRMDLTAPHQINPHPTDTMIKLRIRDKYVVVKEAPWRVFDQFEVFIFPTSLQFTKNFYEQFKNFFFADMPNMDVDKSMEEIQKYELLVPSKALKKAQSKFKAKAKEDDSKLLVAIDKEQTQIKIKQQHNQDAQQQMMLHSNDDIDQDVDPEEEKKRDSKIEKCSQQFQFPIFFRYIRMNEIGVSITYYHNKNSFFNTKDLKIKMTPFIRHGKFVTFKKMFEKYEHHCRKNFISQIPSLIKQKFLQTRENFKGNLKDLDDDDDEQQEIKKELKLHNARKILFGEYYE